MEIGISKDSKEDKREGFLKSMLRSSMSAAVVAAGLSLGFQMPKIEAYAPSIAVPSLTFSDISQNGKTVKINGQNFFIYNNNSDSTTYWPKGSLKNPRIVCGPHIPSSKEIESELTYVMASYRGETKKSIIDKYRGPSFYAFGICAAQKLPEGISKILDPNKPYVSVSPKELATAIFSNTPDKVGYVESVAPLTWKAYLTDINALYGFNKNTKSFVDYHVQYYDWGKGFMLCPGPLLVKKGVEIVMKDVSYNISMFSTSVIAREDFRSAYQLPPGAFEQIRGLNFIYQTNTAPGGGDGTKEFPYEEKPNYAVWRGSGWYSFRTNVFYNPEHGCPSYLNNDALFPIASESATEITSKGELNKYYAAVYGVPISGMRMPNMSDEKMYTGEIVDKKRIITGKFHLMPNKPITQATPIVSHTEILAHFKRILPPYYYNQFKRNLLLRHGFAP